MPGKPGTSRFALAVLGAAIVGCTGCLNPQDFEVKAVGISDLKSLGNAETTVGIDIGLYNPNGYAVEIEGSELGLWLAGESVGVLRFAEGEKIGRRAEALVRLNAVLDSKKLSGVIAQHWFEFLLQGAPVRVEGWVRGKSWGIHQTLEIRHTQQIRVLE